MQIYVYLLLFCLSESLDLLLLLLQCDCCIFLGDSFIHLFVHSFTGPVKRRTGMPLCERILLLVIQLDQHVIRLHVVIDVAYVVAFWKWPTKGSKWIHKGLLVGGLFVCVFVHAFSFAFDFVLG